MQHKVTWQNRRVTQREVSTVLSTLVLDYTVCGGCVLTPVASLFTPFVHTGFLCHSQSVKMVNLGEIFPDFSADTSKGKINFHEWLGDSWGILFSHPADYTPVCTTELGAAANMAGEFAKRNVKMIALSVDSVESHLGWIKDIQANSKLTGDFPYPIIADNRTLAVKFGMLDPDEVDKAGMPLTARCVFIIGPDKKLKLSILYPATTGRNFDEILRVIDSLQLTATKKVATPVNWKQGGDCMVVPSVQQEDIPKLFPKGVTMKPVPSNKTYLRITPQP